MSNIRLDLGSPVYDGQTLTFKSPADCSQVTGLIVYYPENDSTVSKTFQFADAHGNNVGSVSLFAENVLVKVILDTELNRAYVQNADTNAYLEGKFNMCAPLISRGYFRGDIDIIDNDVNLHDNSVVTVNLSTVNLPYSGTGILETITSEPGEYSLQNLTYHSGVKCHRFYDRTKWTEWEFELDTIPMYFNNNSFDTEYRLTKKCGISPMFARFASTVLSTGTPSVTLNFPNVRYLHIEKCMTDGGDGKALNDYFNTNGALSVVCSTEDGTPSVTFKYDGDSYIIAHTIIIYTK